MPRKQMDTVCIRTSSLPDKAEYVMNVDGDGMWPVYKTGDQVLIQTTDTLETGEIGVFKDGKSYFLRQYYPDGLRVFRPDQSNYVIDERKHYRVFARVLCAVTPEMRCECRVAPRR